MESAINICSSSFFLRFFISFFLLVIIILCSLGPETGFALAETELFHTVQVKSLLPATTCDPSSTQGNGKKDPSILKVVHKHGPCSQPNNNQSHKENTPSLTQILHQDQLRVNSIHSRRHSQKQINHRDGRQSDSGATIKAYYGIMQGTGNYVVAVGLGTPKRQLSLEFDTGSSLTWTQCKPCVRPCYRQAEPIFDPSASTSYANVSCNSQSCSLLRSATGIPPRCLAATSTCVYGTQYGDGSLSVGFFAKERLTLTSTQVFDEFLFGCGEVNQGLFGSTAGLLGLDRDNLSFVEQTANKYDRLFSYCLPSSTGSTGYLRFGRGRLSRGYSYRVKFTPFSTLPKYSSFYGLKLAGIIVNGRRLPISGSIFSTSGAIIDSGTVITRLPPTAYGALRDAFQKAMKGYPAAPGYSILDTCYDYSSFERVYIPKVGVSFEGGYTLDLDESGIMIAASASQVCLAFAANDADKDLTVFGNVQQKRLEVVYDVAGGKIGFAPRGCT